MLLKNSTKTYQIYKSTINENKTITMEDLLKKIQIKYPNFKCSKV